MDGSRFPHGFLWGVATAAYQVEGSPLADGAGPSSWHAFAHRRGTVKDGTTGDIACDHYRRWNEDIQLMRDLGIRAYRFSVGWPRIFPEKGRRNQKGIDFYSRLVDALLQAGIQPWVTIVHLDEPLWLSREGGFARRDAVDQAVELGTALFRSLGDRVRGWITINEPTIHAVCGYLLGEFPPGRRYDLRGLFHCVHHLLLAHGRLCESWEAHGGHGMIGLAHHSVWISPADPRRERDQRAASFMDEAANRVVLDGLFRRSYPPRVLRRLRAFFPRRCERDLEEMVRPGSYLGINYYTRIRYRASAFLPFSHAVEVSPPGAPRSAMWEIFPEGMYRSLLRLKDEYGNPPCYVTENGFPLPETPRADPLEDGERIAYLADHVAQMANAVREGVDCRGYFCWSLLDNFEWNRGLSMRFGLLRTDFQTQQRSWKRSAAWYRELLRRNHIPPAPAPGL